jgi:hypothetical protein
MPSVCPGWWRSTQLFSHRLHHFGAGMNDMNSATSCKHVPLTTLLETQVLYILCCVDSKGDHSTQHGIP